MDSRRRDIDGWRGVCILGIVLFHFYPKVFSNGFLGVDVFFIIAGYLSYGSFDKDMNRDRKSFIFAYFDYLKRRFKRLLPAYLVCLLVVSDDKEQRAVH